MTNDNRVPAGSPEGGQWTKGSRQESSIEMMTDEDFKARSGGLSAAEVVEACQRLGIRYSRRAPGIDAEELEGDTIEHFMRACRSDKKIENARAYLKTKTHGLTVHAIVGTSRGPDIKAHGQWLTRRNEWENENNAIMPDSMRNELATTIRDEFLERGEQPPTINFHLRSVHQSHASLDAMTTDEDGRTRDFIPTTAVLGGAQSEEPVDAEYVAQVDAVIDEHAQALRSKSARTAAKKMDSAYVHAYEVMDRGEGPQVQEKSLSDAQASRFKRIVDENGGPHAVAKRIVDGSASREEQTAFMSPFGRQAASENHSADHVASLIAERGSETGNTLWGALNRHSSGAKLSARLWTPAESEKYAQHLGDKHRDASRALIQRMHQRGLEEQRAAKRGQKVENQPASEQEQATTRALLAPWRHSPLQEREQALRQMANAPSPAAAQAIWKRQMMWATDDADQS